MEAIFYPVMQENKRETELTGLGTLCQQFRLALTLLQLLAIAGLQPTLCGDVVVAVLVCSKMGKILGEAANLGGLSFLGSVVGRRQPSQRRSRRKEREEVGWELVRHFLFFFRIAGSREKRGKARQRWTSLM